jgi:hypothetical protein
MRKQAILWSLALALSTAVAGCSNGTSTPTSPSGNGDGSSTAAADGTTLKATAPTALAPRDRVAVDSLRPTLSIQSGRGKFVEGSLSHKFELYEENTLVGSWTASGGNNVDSVVPESITLKYSTLYRWRARAELSNSFGPWSATADFTTPAPPRATPGAGGGSGGAPVAGQRNIGLNEAWDMIIGLHNTWRTNLGSGSSREDRVAFLWSAVAVIHYGHPVYNPAGGDPNWCVKDAGGGRPPSDDVLVRCDSREAWDLIGGAGANGYSFHLDYLGRLDGAQNVYAPPLSSLPR